MQTTSPATAAAKVPRLILVAFLLTFIGARVLVFAIMARLIPDLYLHVGEGQTHVHHLNYGIFLLSGIGAYLLLIRPQGKNLERAALIYGAGLALTFDEFGMWLHLGGPYWQRASFDAIVVIAAVLSLIAAAPKLKHFTWHEWLATVAIIVALVLFTVMWAKRTDVIPRAAQFLHQLESKGPM